jgi:3-hydroxymyristoyl/3-hydroxydecanoyl-(acyl carrier protein) dehydratase
MENSGEGVGYKNVTNCEYLAVDPMTNKRVFPPPFIVEAMGQAGIIFFEKQARKTPGKPFLYLFAGLDDVEFYDDVFPGDVLSIRIYFEKIVSTATIIRSVASVNDKLVAKAKLSVSIREQ